MTSEQRKPRLRSLFQTQLLSPISRCKTFNWSSSILYVFICWCRNVGIFKTKFDYVFVFSHSFDYIKCNKFALQRSYRSVNIFVRTDISFLSSYFFLKDYIFPSCQVYNICLNYREIDGNIYPGEIKEKDIARNTYENARWTGQSAGHIETRYDIVKKNNNLSLFCFLSSMTLGDSPLSAVKCC